MLATIWVTIAAPDSPSGPPGELLGSCHSTYLPRSPHAAIPFLIGALPCCRSSSHMKRRMRRGSTSCAAQHRQRWRRRAVQRKRRQRRRAQFSPPRGGAVDQRYARALPREPFPARAPCHSAETLWQGATWQPPAARAAARSTFAAIPFMFLSYPCCNRLQVNPRPPLVAAAGTAVAAAAAAPATAGAAIATIIADTIRCRRSRLCRHRCRHSHHRRHCCRLCRLRLSRSHRHRQRSPPLPSPPLPCSPLDSRRCCCCYCHSYHHRSRHRHR